jgi:hypothetical protein
MTFEERRRGVKEGETGVEYLLLNLFLFIIVLTISASASPSNPSRISSRPWTKPEPPPISTGEKTTLLSCLTKTLIPLLNSNKKFFLVGFRCSDELGVVGAMDPIGRLEVGIGEVVEVGTMPVDDRSDCENDEFALA